MRNRFPDVYEVLLIGGANDGERVNLTRKFVEQNDCFQKHFALTPQPVVAYEELVNSTVHTSYGIEVYYLELVSEHVIVGRHESLTIPLMWRRLLAGYRPRDRQITTEL